MPRLQLHEEFGQLSVRMTSGKTLAVYRFAPNQRHACFHPLFSPESPEPLTCFAPYDHPWHRGLWWTWKYINGYLFWEPSVDRDGLCQVMDHHAREVEDGSILIRQRLEMRAAKDRSLLMTERRTLRLVPEVPGLASAWAIDWTAEFKAETDCELSVTKFPEERWGGYGGLNFRPNRTLAFVEQILNSDGLTRADDCHGKPARWAAYAGVLDGDPHAPIDQPRRAGLAMFDHPSNCPHPTPWYVWSSGENNRAFGFLAASPLMLQTSRRHRAGEEFTQRYRVVLFDGPISGTALDQGWANWVKSAPSRASKSTPES